MQAHPSRVHRLDPRIGPSRLPLRVVLHSRRPVASGLSEPQTSSSSVAPGPAPEAASLGAQPDFASAPPRPAREAAVCRSLCSSRPVSPGRRNTRAAADLAPGPADKSRPFLCSCSLRTLRAASPVPGGWPLCFFGNRPYVCLPFLSFLFPSALPPSLSL